MRLRTMLICLCFAPPIQAQQTELIVPGQNLFVNNIFQSQMRYGVNGAGITVSIKEFQFDSTDVDLQGRVLKPLNAAANSSIHAGIITTLVAGAGNADLQGRGAAPACKVVSSSFVGLMPDADYSSQNISVQNHSYGVNIQNWYGTGALAYDETTEENPALLHVFSAGNKGDSASLSGTYAEIQGFANLSGNFKMAKNVLLAGAVDSLGNLDPFSSSGPAYDGRIKPDLVAFGLDGTSGAAALVSGAAAVIQQTLRNDFSGLPPSSLVRAILINAADEMGAPGPDFKSGFGNLNLKRSVLEAFNQHYATASIAAGQTVSIPLTLPVNLRQCKLTLVWNDPSAALFAPKSLINDLDALLVSPDGTQHLPWVLNTAPHPDSLRQPAHRGRDTLNNIEQITVENPMPGLWKIQVTAPALTGNQTFALAWSWDTLAHFEWNYPSLNVPAPAGKEVILRWDHNLPDEVARLEWKPFLGTNWQLISDSVSLTQGWRRWSLPDTFTEAQVRMLVGGHEFRSEIFLISRELRIKIGFNCRDSVMLYWNSAHPGAHYWLYGLGKEQMEFLTSTTDTFLVLPKAAYPQQRFAVAPLAQEEDALGPRSSAPDIHTQGVECYFSNFLAALNVDAQAALQLQIGTTNGIQKIAFEKQIHGQFVPINEQLVSTTEYEFVDENLQLGVNMYRPKILLNNGAILTGDTARVYWSGAQSWRVYPNPVAGNGLLNVISATDSEAFFSLFDPLGKMVLEKILEDVNVGISLNGLPCGIYFFKINNDTVFLGEGKVVIK